MLKITNITRCVRSQNGLEIVIMNAPDYSLQPTLMKICKDFIYIDTPNHVTRFRGICVINKNINFHNTINTQKKCIIDALGKSRHMYVENSTLIFNRMTFMNGREVNDYNMWVGSLSLISSSAVFNN